MSAALESGMIRAPDAEAFSLPRVASRLLLSAAALLIALFAGRAVQPALNRPLAAVRVDGFLTHLSPAQIAAAAALPPNVRIFDADLPALRGRIEQLPWVAHARVSRIWPETLDIRVWERVPAARWNDDSLLDSEGAAFTPSAPELAPAAIAALPRLGGPAGRETEVIGAYRALSQALKGSEFAPAGLSLDARGEWRLRTVRGIELRLGDGDPLAHVALLLGAVSKTLGAQLDQVDYIDLRYSNGFAVSNCAGAPSATAPQTPEAAAFGCSAAAPITAAPASTHNVVARAAGKDTRK